MEYYINPMWFYWLSISAGVKFLFGFMAVFIGIAVFCFQIWYIETMIYDANQKHEEYTSTINRRKAKPYLIVLWIVFAFCLLVWLFMPSRSTLIEMMIAKQATVQNAESALETIKSAVDYVVQAIQNAK